MRRRLLLTAAAVAVAPSAIAGFPAQCSAQVPPMAGGYKDVIAIPVTDPDVKTIAGALFKPEGAGPFPAIIYMNGCGALDYPPDRATQQKVIEHSLPKGFATLIVDPFSARGETKGICDKVNQNTFSGYGARGAADIWAAFKLLCGRSDIDAKRIFVEGYDYGAFSALFATASPAVAAREAKPAGVIAYYPYCGFTVYPVPTFIFIGDKDGVVPPELCKAQSGKTNVEVVVYPGATHGFAAPGMNDVFGGVALRYDETAAKDAQARADAFIAAHMK